MDGRIVTTRITIKHNAHTFMIDEKALAISRISYIGLGLARDSLYICKHQNEKQGDYLNKTSNFFQKEKFEISELSLLQKQANKATFNFGLQILAHNLYGPRSGPRRS